MLTAGTCIRGAVERRQTWGRGREREALWFGRVGDVMRGRFPSVAPIVARAERVNPTVSSESASPKSKIKLNSLNLLGKTKKLRRLKY